MYLEAVIVCVNYADFLAHTLPYNKVLFDRVVIVTDTKDKATQNLCEHLNIECVKTDIFYENGDKFNKGKGINVGLSRLSKKGWVIHLDADIYLAPQTRNILEKIEGELHEDMIYGIDRMMCPDYKSWINYIENPKPMNEGWIYTHTNIFPIGVRIAEYTNKGWEPIGFFQMWNPKGSQVFSYPQEHGAADRTDVQFAKKWSRSKRQLLPEILSIHLDSESLNIEGMGKNWNGRKTDPFTYKHSLECEKIKELEHEIICVSKHNFFKSVVNIFKLIWKKLYY